MTDRGRRARRWALGHWRIARRFAVPRAMIEDAAELRAAGDWRGACAAARVDVAFDLAAVARDHGAEATARLEDDLCHFVPDLLRWHLPRTAMGDAMTLLPRRWFRLGVYGGERPTKLYAVTPPSPLAPQRISLVLDSEVSVRDDWTTARYLFDDRHHLGLLRHYGGDVRAPFFHADGTPRDPRELPASEPGADDVAARTEWATLLAEREGEDRADPADVFAAAGIALIREIPPESRRGRDPHAVFGRITRDAPALAYLIDRATVPGLRPTPMSIEWERIRLHAESGGKHPRPLLWRVRGDERGNRWPVPGCWHRLPDLDLLRTEMIAPDELHPLVRAALFPARGGGPSGPPEAALPGPVRVRCQGVWHQVRSAGGGLEIPHDEDEARREAALGAFGGPVGRCFAVRRAWQDGHGWWLPRALREHRREVFLRAQHGDAAGVLRLLDAGLYPGIRDGRRWTLLHMLHVMDHEVLLPRLLDAGVDVDAADHEGCTPLFIAVAHRGSPALVRALLDAGARTAINGGPPRTARPYRLEDAIKDNKRDDLEFLL